MQLDLFESKTGRLKQATIHVFPLNKRVSLIRDTATKLRRMSKSNGRKFWSGLVGDLSKEMSQLSAPEIESQLQHFTVAVRSKIVGFGASGPEESPRGSARVANLRSHALEKSS